MLKRAMEPPGRAAHAMSGGPELRSDSARRGFSVRCSCGWESELCATPAFAEAAGEQHVELERWGVAR